MMRLSHLIPRNLPGLFLFIGLFLASNLPAQDIIGQLHMRDFSVDKSIYPYGWLQYGGDYHEVGFKPIVKINESDFAYLWKPELGYKKRNLSCFNLLMEQQWESEIVLEDEEDIFAMYLEGDTIILLSYHFKVMDRMHHVKARKYKASDGSFIDLSFIYQIEGKSFQVVGYDFSTDSSKLVFYHFLDNQNNKKVRNMLDYPYPGGGAGFKVSNSDKAYFQVFNRRLDTLAYGEMELVSQLKTKSYVVDGQVDDEGNVVFSVFQEPNFLSVHRFDIETKTKKMLKHEGVPDPFKHAPYGAMLPPHLGKDGRVYASYAGREKIRAKRYTRYFKVINFDFGRDLVDSSRTIPITSSFQVQLNKSREAFNMKPETIFDHYLIKDLIEMDDGKLWMIAQKYERGTQPKRMNSRTINLDDTFVSSMEEILLFEFEPNGKIHKVIMVPMLQQAILPMERVGRFYSYQLDKEEKMIHLITREYNGENHNQPPRIFYRKVDLEAGTYSDRQQIFDGDRRTQYYLRDYTLFLNPFVVIMTVVDGDLEEHPDIVSVKLGEIK